MLMPVTRIYMRPEQKGMEIHAGHTYLNLKLKVPLVVAYLGEWNVFSMHLIHTMD